MTLNRSYVETLHRFTNQNFNTEFNEGIDYIESYFNHQREAYLYSTRFWNWWKDQQDMFAMNLLQLNSIEPNETVLNPLAEEALLDAYQHYKLKFKATPPYPSPALSKKILKEYLTRTIKSKTA